MLSVEILKSRWNEVLDLLLSQDRVAWLAFFDARITKVSNQNLHLDFSDANKLGGAHSFVPARNTANQQALRECIYQVFGENLEIIIE